MAHEPCTKCKCRFFAEFDIDWLKCFECGVLRARPLESGVAVEPITENELRLSTQTVKEFVIELVAKHELEIEQQRLAGKSWREVTVYLSDLSATKICENTVTTHATLKLGRERAFPYGSKRGKCASKKVLFRKNEA